MTYIWNVRNQLTAISKTGLWASFTYDSFGRRTGKTINGTRIIRVRHAY
jgi:YD repeat-containing protein